MTGSIKRHPGGSLTFNLGISALLNCKSTVGPIHTHIANTIAATKATQSKATASLRLGGAYI